MSGSRSMQLVVDIGNTRIKFACFQSGVLVQKWYWEDWPIQPEKELERLSPEAVMLSSSGKANWKAWFVLFFEKKRIPVRIFGWEYLKGIQLAYEKPETLGGDRMAAIWAASNLYKEKALLIADLGTCLTLDILLNGKNHVGGSISPGLSMRFRAMHEYTAALPLGHASEETGVWGKTTQECLAVGAIWGIVSEIEQGLKRVQESSQQWPKLILTGGDAEFFAQRINSANFVAPDLVLHGLYLALKNSDIA